MDQINRTSSGELLKFNATSVRSSSSDPGFLRPSSLAPTCIGFYVCSSAVVGVGFSFIGDTEVKGKKKNRFELVYLFLLLYLLSDPALSLWSRHVISVTRPSPPVKPLAWNSLEIAVQRRE